MTRKTYHVSPSGDGGWKVKAEGASRASGVHEAKAPAIAQARELAGNAGLGQVVIHSAKGRIQEERTYNQDPYPPRG